MFKGVLIHQTINILEKILSVDGIQQIDKSQQKKIQGKGANSQQGHDGPQKPECGYIIPGTTNHIKECGTNYYCASGRCKYIYPGPE